VVEPFPGPPLLDGKYLLERRLGAGGMGSVYSALHLGLGKLFAVKVIRSLVSVSPQAVARFRIEAQALGRLSHPHVVNVTDYGVDPRDGGLPYLVMEYLPGESLLGHIHRHGPLGPEEAVRLLAPVAAALDYAHAEGVLHRDLKPSNIFLAATEDGGLTPKLLDFGLARFAGQDPDPLLPDHPPPPESAEMPTVPLAHRPRVPPASARTDLPTALTAPEGIVGTPQFFAPEVIEGSAPSPASDVWAFGVLGYAALTGTLPYEGIAPDVLTAILRDEPDPPSRRNPVLDPALDAALLAPLARDPARPPASATEWIAAVDRAARAVRSRRLRAREAPRRLLLASAVALAMALVGSAAASLIPLSSADEALLDARYRIAPSRTADPRLLLVSIDETTLRADPSALSAKGDEAAALLEAAFAAGATGVAIDLLLPPAWGASPGFARCVVSRSGRLALAALSGEGDEVVGPEALGGPVALALGERAASLFAFANLTPDRDGTVRRARTLLATSAGARAPSFATRAASLLQGSVDVRERAYLVDHRIDANGFRRLSFHGAREALEGSPGLAKGKLILLGAEFEGSGDLHPNPRRRSQPLTGLELQALAVQTLLDGEPLRDAPRLLAAAVAFPPLLAVAFGALWLPARPASLLAIPVALLVPFASAFGAFLAAGLVLPVAAPSVSLALAGAAGAFVRTRLPSLDPSSQEA
jgi:serine/threonine protein kinase/CHASE2 domain-containing sensor protein